MSNVICLYIYMNGKVRQFFFADSDQRKAGTGIPGFKPLRNGTGSAAPAPRPHPRFPLPAISMAPPINEPLCNEDLF